MNCEAYIVTAKGQKFHFGQKLSFFPDNFDTSPLQKAFGGGEIKDNELGIQRVGDMVYYMYLRELEDVEDTKAGIAVALNSVMVDDVVALHAFFQKIMRSMVCQYNVASFDKSTAEHSESRYQANYDAAINRLRTAFCAKFDGKEVPLGPQHYAGTSERTNLHIKEDRTVMQMNVDQGPYANAIMRRNVQQGDTVIISSAVPDEQHIAQLETKVASLTAKKLEQKQQINALKTQLSNLLEHQPIIKTSRQSNQPQNSTKQIKIALRIIKFGGIMFGFILGLFFIGLSAGWYIKFDMYHIFRGGLPWFQFEVFLLALILGVLIGWQKLCNEVFFWATASAYLGL